MYMHFNVNAQETQDFAPHPIAVELANRTWDNDQKTMDFLHQDNTVSFKVNQLCTQDIVYLNQLVSDYENTISVNIGRSAKSVKVFIGVADAKKKIPLKTVRDYFELQLLPEYRLAAFNNAIKKKLDYPAKNLHDAFCVAMDNDLGGTKEGLDFWYRAINESGYNC